MKQNLIQINDNFGVVSDEKGNISLISKENDSHDFEKILLKENELENLQLQLKECKVKEADNKQKIKEGEITNAFLVVGGIALYVALHSVLPLEMLLLVMGIYYVPLKCVLSLIYGTRIGRYITKKKLTIDIAKLELDVPTLEKELAKIKEKSKFKVDCSTVVESKEKIYPENLLSIDSYISEAHNKVRVLSLSKRK